MIESVKYKDGGVIIRLRDNITSKEIIEVNTNILNSDGFESLRFALWIFESIRDFNVSSNDVYSIALQDLQASERNKALKVALVTETPLSFGLSRMWEAYYSKGPWEHIVTKDEDKAMEWINS